MNENPSKPADEGKLEFWALLELFGHQKIAGFVREVTLGGDVLLRVDVPEISGTSRTLDYTVNPPRPVNRPFTISAFTKFYSPKSVFSMTPVSEETARQMMQSFRIEPIQPFEPRKLLASPDEPVAIGRSEDDEDDDPGF